MAKWITWDWKEQPPLEQLIEAVNGDERMFLAEVPDTGADRFALLISQFRFNPAETQAIWDAFMGDFEEFDVQAVAPPAPA